MTSDFEYAGTELELFSEADTWRTYWASHVSPYLGKRVLEVGAGIGSVTHFLRESDMSWTTLEPDPALASRISRGDQDDSSLEIVVGELTDLPSDEQFDSILYIDVLEHIDDDQRQIDLAYERLAPGGFLIVLAPAHQWLYTPFDAAIGHFRRYSMSALRRLQPGGSQEIVSRYLDSIGVLASSANKVLLKTSHPTRRQIRAWDRRLVPVSRFVDRMLAYRVGKSALIIWMRPLARTPEARK